MRGSALSITPTTQINADCCNQTRQSHSAAFRKLFGPVDCFYFEILVQVAGLMCRVAGVADTVNSVVLVLFILEGFL